MSAFLLLAWLAAVDGGTPPTPAAAPAKPKMSAEDAELLRHLEVLEALDEARDLDMLEELSVDR